MSLYGHLIENADPSSLTFHAIFPLCGMGGVPPLIDLDLLLILTVRLGLATSLRIDPGDLIAVCRNEVRLSRFSDRP